MVAAEISRVCRFHGFGGNPGSMARDGHVPTPWTSFGLRVSGGHRLAILAQSFISISDHFLSYSSGLFANI